MVIAVMVMGVGGSDVYGYDGGKVDGGDDDGDFLSSRSKVVRNQKEVSDSLTCIKEEE